MKAIIKIAFSLSIIIGITSCELDNLPGPDSGLSGRIVDSETGALVPQDIINGTLIEIWEQGWESVTPQRLEVKNDGTYRDTRLFGAVYDIIPINTNFHNNATLKVDTVELAINGQTELDFSVTPYVRIVDLDISSRGTKVTANFKLEQPIDSVFLTSADTVKRAVLVEEVSLLAHYDPNVGWEMSLADESTDIDAVIQAGVNDEYSITLDISRKAALDTGGKIFFRVGAKSNMPASRPNYGATVELDFVL